MPDEDNVIDVEAVEIEEGDNLPAVISDAWNAEALEADSVTRSNGKTYTAKAGRSADGLSLDAAKVAKHDAALAANPERRCVAMTSKGQCRKVRDTRQHGVQDTRRRYKASRKQGTSARPKRFKPNDGQTD